MKWLPPSRLAAGLLAAALSTPAVAEVDRAAFVRLAASVLKVEVLRLQGGYSLGSGVVVGAQQIVTNCHVTRDARTIYVLRGGVRWRARLQAASADHDLCLLHAAGLVAEPVRLGSARSLSLGQPVSALGYTGGTGIQNSAGEVLALHRLDGAPVIQSSNWFSSGASGGGLFDDELRLVGILTFRLRGADAHYFAAPVEWLAPLLDAADEHRGEPASEAAAASAPVASGPGEVAYWQRPIERRPRFLRAASLAHDEQWDDLQTLAREWLHADATDPEPWYFLGEALSRQDRPTDARRAFACALAIDAAYVPAAAQLARLDQRHPAPADSAASAARPCAAGVP